MTLKPFEDDLRDHLKATIIIPARNEADNLRILIPQIKQLSADEFELIVVDDGSSDGTGEIARVLGAKVIVNEKIHGKGQALRCGFERAASDVIVTLDGDLSHRVKDIPTLLAPLADSRVGMVIASRILGGSDEYTAARWIGNISLSGLCNVVFGVNLTDALNGFKAFRKPIASRTRCRGFGIEIELLAQCIRSGYQVCEVSSHERARAYGVAKSSALREGLLFFRQIITEGIRLRIAS